MTPKKIIKKFGRKIFGKLKQIINPTSLLSIQINSFDKLHNGIDKVLNSFFPIRNNKMNLEFQYISYTLGNSLFNEQECIIRGLTYTAPLKVNLYMILDDEAGKPLVKKQDIYLCDIPLMTKRGSFVINGTERVFVSQLHRSPGVIFSRGHSGFYNARIIPYKGIWLDLEFDSRDRIFFRINRQRKLPVTILLKALNYSTEDIQNKFVKKRHFKLFKNGKVLMHVIPSSLLDEKSLFNLKIVDLVKGQRITLQHIKLMEKYSVSWVDVQYDTLVGERVTKNYINDSTCKIICFAYTVLTEKLIRNLLKGNITNLEIIRSDVPNYIAKTLMSDKSDTTSSAVKVIYKYYLPGLKYCEGDRLEDIFFSEGTYNFSEVGRTKFNQSFPDCNLSKSLTLTKQDIIVTLQKLIDIKDGQSKIDDIDHLGNRRIRSVGEMLENQLRLSLIIMKKLITERFVYTNNRSSLMPSDIINNVIIISSLIKELLTGSQLSQFMDQINPLAEITHKRRISALGPGGITRERANLEIRDVHTTHYGRICPIETPEGPNIGLINSFALYARVNKHGFIETPYIKVIKGKVTNDIEYLTATKEEDYIICQADAFLSKNEEVVCRYKGESSLFHKNDINYMDISPQQIVSIGAALIPFIEHNDANRALMGANMQRQAVPLLITEQPLIGTGMERKVAIDAGVTVVAKRGGIVHYVDAYRIVIQVDPSEIGSDLCLDIYKLNKFLRSNQNTCMNQRPRVMLGEQVIRGEIIADGPATDMGELALGKNLRVAFMSWYGYNFEDSIIISERVVQEQLLTSIHIHELICIARDTKLGSEEITSDIPSDASKLDESGIIVVGTEVKEGDILVGKLTPKGVTSETPEERFFQAIFPKKNLVYNILDTSLRVPLGMSGTVIDVQIFSNEEKEEDPLKDFNKEISVDLRIIEDNIFKQIKSFLKEEPYLDNKAKSILYGDSASSEDLKYLFKLNFTGELNLKIDHLRQNYQRLNEYLQNQIQLEKKKMEFGSNLEPDIIKIVKIYLAIKRNIQPGDKIAGRHGNKGVVSLISRIEDMPYDEDGTPVDIILNPLSVPSRMNVGQIFETHLGLALKKIGSIINQLIKQDNLVELRSFLHKVYELGNKVDISSFSDEEILILANNIKLGLPITSPVFDGVTEDEIQEMFKLTSLPLSGQIDLYDGFTGEKFERPITVGYMYILKLNHLVDEKIHARSTGSYSLVTQQPLGGKSQFGGQRFGEMEVWSLEGSGATFTLQEMLTVKSDDVYGRNQMYKNIVDGNYHMFPTIPESFNLLLKEMKSLCLNIEIEYYDDDDDDDNKQT